MISNFDLKLIHETFIDLKLQYPDKSVRFQYFLATCLYLDADISLDFVLKNRPYGGLIGIDNSSLDKHLKHFKFLRIQYYSALFCMTQRDICKKKIIPVLGTHMFCLVQ